MSTTPAVADGTAGEGTPPLRVGEGRAAVGEGRAAVGERRTAVGERRAALHRTRPPEPVSAVPTPVAAVVDGDAVYAAAVAAAVYRARLLTEERPAAARITRQQRRAPKPTGVRPVRRSTTTSAFLRRRATVPVLSFLAVFGFVGGSLVNPLQGGIASAAVIAPSLPTAPSHSTVPAQQYTAHGTYADVDMARDGYDITKPAPVVVAPVVVPTATGASASTKSSAATGAPVAGSPNPGSAKAIALQMVTARGWGTDEYNCLVSLWNKESSWNVYAYNPSGAYGIPQSLPGSKMATAGADWQTNPATQITWGLNYITGSYGTPCGAWGHSVAHNWY